MAQSDRYRSLSDLPQRIPVFPLRGAILLPRASLPLNVFEPRYLSMIDDALSGSRMIGVIQPATDGQSESPTGKSVNLKRIGCAGRISSYQELDDNRLIISLTGVARFEVTSEVPTLNPYRIMSVDYAPFAGSNTSDSGAE